MRLKNEITGILSQYKGSTEEVRKISQELTSASSDGSISGGGIPIKNLILSIELAIESSPNNTLEYGIFMEAFRSVNRDYI